MTANWSFSVEFKDNFIVPKCKFERCLFSSMFYGHFPLKETIRQREYNPLWKSASLQILKYQQKIMTLLQVLLIICKQKHDWKKTILRLRVEDFRFYFLLLLLREHNQCCSVDRNVQFMHFFFQRGTVVFGKQNNQRSLAMQHFFPFRGNWWKNLQLQTK